MKEKNGWANFIDSDFYRVLSLERQVAGAQAECRAVLEGQEAATYQDQYQISFSDPICKLNVRVLLAMSTHWFSMHFGCQSFIQ